MRTHRWSTEHQEAVSRRLSLLGAELAAQAGSAEVRTGATGGGDVAPDPYVESDAAPSVDSARGVAVPVPGRHAARRIPRAVPTAPGAGLPGRLVLAPAQLTVVALLVAAALAVTCWWVLDARSQRLDQVPADPAGSVASPVSAQELPSPAAGSSPDASSPGARSDGASGAAEPVTAGTDGSGSVVVDVTGKVRRPGIVVLVSGARVIDALKAAGGARKGVDLSALNLARVLVDGEQIVVGRPVPGGVAASASAPPGSVAPGDLVNINTADQARLEELPQVGPVTAQAILSWRQEHGGFTAIDQLLDVDGIGEATLSQLAPLVTL
ncbi:MAG: helix-hairpin-helix domain-containing protein [Nocardioides sp.]|uniref:helix-hairpin-helix domain-containing protein n=1 Tax=Nocardioides sp. TaxID=35761 RepID=UPI0039E567C5